VESIKISIDTAIALLALAVSIIALGISVYFWRRQFRPIVTAAIKTHGAGNEAIAYDLVLLNSGSIPAKDITLKVTDESLQRAFGTDATPDNKTRWLACFLSTTQIRALHNGDHVSCSFGMTRANDSGFWKMRAQLAITIEYTGWFGKSYVQQQTLEIRDSTSFTGFMWG
jgi:hypothetical protein